MYSLCRLVLTRNTQHGTHNTEPATRNPQPYGPSHTLGCTDSTCCRESRACWRDAAPAFGCDDRAMTGPTGLPSPRWLLSRAHVIRLVQRCCSHLLNAVVQPLTLCPTSAPAHSGKDTRTSDLWARAGMCVCIVYICVHAHATLWARARACVCIYVCMCVCARARARVHIHTYMHTHGQLWPTGSVGAWHRVSRR